MTLLIDADYTVYKCCAAAEEDYDFGDDVIVVTSRFSEAMRLVKRDLNQITDALGSGFDEPILFFSSPRNFRKEIDPSYKGHSNRKKPCGYKRVIEALSKEYCVVIEEGMEADDALGIFATNNPGSIICSPDKDLKQIPGKLYNLKDPVQTITPEAADEWFFIQTMAGDMTDGYSGVPGIGVKRAAELLKKDGCTWDTVLSAFKKKDMTEEQALMNARLARILTNDLYVDGEIKLWDPSHASNRADNRTGVSVAANNGDA